CAPSSSSYVLSFDYW
nr:immunoglobulin heavy chain junction region [Macaca mulatta]MPN83841.1 immunoglobulin heavy chain junction region [Macaca mulatta]MPN83879.1 immunoglobulin heavy chain junction region [Macaca mulatta]MPN83884.1 immunoglobulin heavy chain junction region [Macaca mulatta]MPN84015.1 immunoglobulin heavy chain junction region [Macaca mulatta]